MLPNFQRTCRLSALLLPVLILLAGGMVAQGAQGDKRPVIEVRPKSHTFPPVFEGEALSYAFTVLNKGETDLHIKKVTHA